MPPIVSVIIPTYKPKKYLERCLQSIKDQTYRDIEVFVVDALKYDTEEQQSCMRVTEGYGFTYIQDGPERSIQRNRGIQEAKGKYLLVIDQDMYLKPKVVEECVQIMEGGRFAALNIPEISIGEGFWTKCVALDRYVSNVLEESMNVACRFFRREDALKIGGYDPEIVGAEDADFHYRMKELGPIGRIKTCILHDEGRTYFWVRVKKKFYYSKAFRGYISRRPMTSIGTYFPVRLAYFKHPLVFLKQPIVSVGMVTLRVFEVGAGALGILLKR